MDDFFERISKLSPKRVALLAVDLHDQLEATRARDSDPIAIVGMGCRLPGGVTTPDAYWELLRSGRDAIREVPPERWDIDAFFDPDPDAPARMSARAGGFLDAIDGFEPELFGIAPREASTMDPQQRLLLEVAWEALEHAGISPEGLAGSSTGVFVGICNSDHFQRVLGRGLDTIDAYLASGNAASVAAGRIAYVLGLQGPAVAIDTACSSSLVALHLACQSLRAGETRVALAAGVNLMCSPETTIALSKAHMLAPDGRCKTFAAAADGFARGEGCGVLVLKRMSDARADGDRVLALVRATASNQDGRSGGLTVPNGPAQEAVIRAALAKAGVAPADIGYVEAHGTGTTLGDPIEVRALAGALGPGRAKDQPLLIGSVKTNLGHLESAAGVAGIMKVILALQNEHIPPHLHFKQPSPHISWADYPVEVTANGRAWPRGEKRRLAGVSSFGFSGTNAHVILEEAPEPAPAAAPTPPAPATSFATPERPLHCLALSARTGPALNAAAARFVTALAGPAAPTLADVAYTAGIGRARLSERLAVVAATNDEASAALAAFEQGEAHPALHRGVTQAGTAPEIVFLYTGQGAQYPGMARKLYDGAPVFRELIDKCDALLGPDAAGRTLTSVLFTASAPGENAPIHETAWTQPALFAVEYALTQLWRSFGVEPAAVIGHSVGEYVAACVAGVFTLEEGLRLIAERGRLMQALPPGGTMAAVFAPVAEVAAAVAPFSSRLAIAAVNSADSVVISGEADAVETVLAAFAQRNVQGHRLFVQLAAHSPLVAPALDHMEACARSVTMRAPQIPVAWNLTGGAPLPGGAPDAVYWRRHLREPVRFADGLATLYRDGYRVFLEVGPHPTLTALAERSRPDERAVFLGSLRRNKDDWSELLHSLAELFVRGAKIDWAGLDRPYPRRRLSLPTYAFQRRRFWIPSPTPGARRLLVPQRDATGAGTAASPLPGGRLPVAVPTYETVLAPDTLAYLGEHRVHGAALLAGPVFLELAQAAARAAFGPATRMVEDLAIREALVLPEEGRVVQTHLVADGSGAIAVAIHSRHVAPSGAGDFQLHATLRLVVGAPRVADAEPPLETLSRTLGPATDCAEHYERLRGLGIDLGPAFRSLREARRKGREVLATVVLPDEQAGDAVTWIHPSALDGAFQAIGLAVPTDSGDGARDHDDVYLLAEVGQIALGAPLPPVFLAHARLRESAGPRPALWRADVTLRRPEGGPDGGAIIGTISDVCLRRASRAALARAAGTDGASAAGWHYRVDWEPAPVRARAATTFVDPSESAAALHARFAELADTMGMSIYEDLLPVLDRLSAGFVGGALRALGFDARPGRRFDAPSEATRLGVVPRHARLFARLLEMLVHDGVLARAGDGFEVATALPPPPSMEAQQVLRTRFGKTDGELSTLGRCGPALAQVLRGDQDPLQLLFPGGSFLEARQLYVESPYARTYNTALGHALKAAIAARQPGTRLRILEIGAGTGGTTTYVLPLLPADATDYTFTDLSPLFLERAAEQFAAFPFVRRALLDIERDPATQGFEGGAYDIVIAANVLHATADLRVAVDHARGLLASGGLLFLLEGVAPERWVDLTFGLTEGWWRFTDGAVRPAYPLVNRSAWHRLLDGLGFTGVVTVPDDGWTARGGAQQALLIARAPVRRRRFLLVGATDTLAPVLSDRLRRRGDQVTIVAADVSDTATGVAKTPTAFSAEESAPPDEIVYLGALALGSTDAETPGAARRAQEVAATTPLRWLGQSARGERTGRPWLVTAGAMPAPHTTLAELAPLQAPLWGLGRVFSLEQPARAGGLIDLPPRASTAELADTLVTALDADDGEDQVAFRPGGRYAARLVAAPAPTAALFTFRPDATYLVTGGFGGLGLLVARFMAEHGARHIALLGRHPDPTSDGVRAIETAGARIIVLTGDVADADAMTACFSRFGDDLPPLHGIMHAAADLGSEAIADLVPEQVTGMLRPKIEGTILLERLGRPHPLDFLVLFSSTTALLGAAGLAHYAAANTFMDTFAHKHNRPNRRVLSVNWGTWEAMRLASQQNQQSFRAAGLDPMPAALALDALGRLLSGTDPQAVVASIDWNVLKPLHEARRPRPFLTHLGTGPAAADGTGTPPAAVGGKAARPAKSVPDLIDKLRVAPAAARRDILVEFVRDQVAAVLGVDGNQVVPMETGLFELGMDSLMSVELKRRLERGAGKSLPSTLTFNYPNVAALVGFLEVELGPVAAVDEIAAAPPSPATATGAAGESENLDALSDDELEARLLAKLGGGR